MADKEPLWNRMVEKHSLQANRYGDLAAWPFGDYVFGCDWDVMSDTLKIRAAGFVEGIDTEAMLVSLLRRYREDRIVP